MTLQELLVKVGMDVSEYTAGVDSIVGSTATVGAAMAKTAGSTDTLMAGIDKLGSSLTRIGVGLTAAITLPMAGVSFAALKLSSDLAQATTGFTTMMGSASLAKSHLDELRKFALDSPFQFTELVHASQRLQALGFSAKQVIPTLTAIGDTVAAMGSGTQGIERISLALGQMQAKGKVSAQEMNQLAEANVRGWDILAESLTKTEKKTVTVGDVMKMAEKGMLDGAAAVQIILTGLEAKFHGQQIGMMSSVAGMFSTLKDQVEKVLTDVGDALTPLAKRLIVAFSGVLIHVQGLVTEFKALPIGLQGSIIGFAALAAAAGPALLVMGGLLSSVSLVSKALGSMSSVFSNLTGPLSAGTGVLSTFATAAAGLGVAFLVFNQVKEISVSLDTLGAALSRNTSGLDGFIGTVKASFSALGSIAESAFGNIGTAAAKIGGAFANLIPESVRSAFHTSMALLVTASNDAANSISQTWAKISIWQTFKDSAGPLGAFNKLLRDMADSVEYFGGKYASMDAAVKSVNTRVQQSILDQTHVPTSALEALAKARGIDMRSDQEKATSVGVPSLIRKDPAQAGKDAKAALDDAAGVLGLTDLQSNMKRYMDAYNLAVASGRFNTEQLAVAWQKVEAAVDAVTRSKGAIAMGPPKAFNPGSLASFDERLDFAASTKVAADNFKEIDESMQAAIKHEVELREEQQRLTEAGLDWGKVWAQTRDSLKDGNQFFVNFDTTIEQAKVLKAAIAEIDKQLAETPNPFGIMNQDAVKFIASLQSGFEPLSHLQGLKSPLADARKKLGLTSVNDEGEAQSAALGAFDVELRSKTSLSELESSWAKVNSQVNALARTNLPEAVRIEGDYINELRARGGAIGDIYVEQEKLLAMEIRTKVNRGESANAEVIALTNLRAKNDAMREQATLLGNLYGDIGHDLSKSWDALGKGFADAIISGKNFGQVMTGVFKELKKQILEDIVGTAFKALKNGLIGLATGGSGAGGGILGSVAGLLKGGGGGLVGTGQVAGGVAGGLDAALGIGSSVAGAAAPAVSSLAGGASSAVSGVAGSSLSAVTGIVTGAVSAVSSIIGNFQSAGMNKSLDIIVKHTLETKNELSNLRRDQWDQHNGMREIANMMYDRLGEFKNAVIERLDNTYTRIGEMLGGGAMTNEDGSVTASPAIFTDLSDSVRSAAQSIVEGIADGVQRIIDALPVGGDGSGGGGGGDSFVNQTETTSTVVPSTAPDVLNAAKEFSDFVGGTLFDLTRSILPGYISGKSKLGGKDEAKQTGIVQGISDFVDKLRSEGLIDAAAQVNSLLSGSSVATVQKALDKVEATAAAARNSDTAKAGTPYTAGIPYDTATTTVKTTIPADQNVVNTLLGVNQSIVQGFAATIEQLKAMGAIGATAAKDAAKTPLTTAEQANQMIKEMTETGATQEEISAKLTSLGFTMAGTAASTQKVAAAVTQYAKLGEVSGVNMFDQMYQQEVARAGTGTQYAKLGEFSGVNMFDQMYQQEVARAGTGTQYAPFGQFSEDTSSGKRWDGHDWVPATPASMYTMPMPKLDGSWNPLTYVPSPGSTNSGTQVHIYNPTFRDPRDANAIVDLVKNSL